MSKKLNLVLGVCDHLPSGARESEYEALYDKKIKPLIQAMDKYPRINIVFHYSGVLLHWIERHHPEFFMLLEDLLSRRQAEFLGGGFYNPMLPLLPLTDKIGQIEMLTTYLRKRFGRRPQGCWLPGMAWEPNLVGPLNSCGMNYTFLDDIRFLETGIKPNKSGLFSPCLTEDQGKLITVFPVAGFLGRALYSEGDVAKILGELLEKIPDGEHTAVVFPFKADGTPWSEQKYEKFLGELSGVDAKIEFCTPAKVHKTLRFIDKAFFPGVCTDSNSGAKKQDNQYSVRHVLAQYPEANGIYTKMIYVHTLINNRLRGDKSRKRTALEELWKAQDSGVFHLGSVTAPGLFRSPVRKAAYRSLLEAEKITREKRKFSPSLSVFDFDLDGQGEYLFQDDKLNYCVKPRGASIFELDYLPASWNYLDTMSPFAGNAGSRRCAFADWLIPGKTISDDTLKNGMYECRIPGSRFCGDEEYEASEADRVKRRLQFTLHAKTGLPLGEIEIEKTWQLKKNTIIIDYLLRNTGAESADFTFIPQLDLSFAGAGEEFVRIFSIREGEKGSLSPAGKSDSSGSSDSKVCIASDVRGLEFQDIKNEAIITLESSRNFNGRILSIKAGFPDLEEYQSTCILPLFSVSIEAAKTWKASLSMKIIS